MDQLIKLNIEIEGLLRVLANRDNPEAVALLNTKINEFNAAYESCTALKNVAEDTPDQKTPESDDRTQQAQSDEVTQQAQSDEVAQQAQDSETIRLEQILTQRSAKDFTKAFTVNDRYRFTRELFDNHPAAFDAAIQRIQGLESLGLAYDYLLNDLEWDPENEAVKDFINIVSNHFNTI